MKLVRRSTMVRSVFFPHAYPNSHIMQIYTNQVYGISAYMTVYPDISCQPAPQLWRNLCLMHILKENY